VKVGHIHHATYFTALLKGIS